MVTKIPSDYFTQSGVFENRYANCISVLAARDIAAAAITKKYGTHLPIPKYGNHPISDWFAANVWIEPRYFDYTIPDSAIRLVETVHDQHFEVLVFTAPIDCGGVIAPHKIASLMHSKDEQFLPKCYSIDHTEVGWVLYNRVGNYNLVHHIQLHGHIKGDLSNNERTQAYRTMLAWYNHLTSLPTVIPSTTTLQRLHIADNHPRVPPIDSLSKHVLKKCGYRRAQLAELDWLRPHSPIFDKVETPAFWIRK